MSFQFVENDKIDEAARKLIRSHVMKGKNIGKVRAWPTRKRDQEVLCSREITTGHRLSSASCKSKDSTETMGLSIPLQVGSTFSSVTFAGEYQPYMANLIYQFIWITGLAVYPSEFCHPMTGGIKKAWFEYLQSDEAFFYSFLAMAEVCMDSMFGRTETSTQALQHLSKTYRCIKENLEKSGTPADSTVAAVMSMAIQEDLRGQPLRSRVHVDALERIVELRGGIPELEHDRLLVQKICRADLQYALCIGAPPRFPRDEFPRETIQSLLNPPYPQEQPFIAKHETKIYDSEIRNVFEDLMTVSRLFNDNPLIRLDPWEWQELLISIYYRLLNRYPLASDFFRNDHENAYYLGMLALMSTIFFNYGKFRRLPYDLLASKLHAAIEKALCNKALEESTILWLLFVGGISIFGADNWAWLSQELKSFLLALNIDSWRTARSRIKSFPWIDVAHDKAGKKLWQALFDD